MCDAKYSYDLIWVCVLFVVIICFWYYVKKIKQIEYGSDSEKMTQVWGVSMLRKIQQKQTDEEDQSER